MLFNEQRLIPGHINPGHMHGKIEFLWMYHVYDACI